MEIIRPEERQFESIKDFPYQANYLNYNGLRMHYVDEGKGEIILALHGEPTWSYIYRKFIPILTPQYRFIAPDLIGFGKSDKIVGWKNYSFGLHYSSLKHFIHKLDLQDITLVVHDWGGLLGLSVLADQEDRFKRVVILNTFLPKGKPLPLTFKVWRMFARYHPSLPISKIIQWGSFTPLSKDTKKAYDLPFPNRSHKAAAKAFPSIIPTKTSHEGVKEMNKAREVLSKWTKPSLILFSDKDPIMSHLAGFFYRLIPGKQQLEPTTIKNASHFLQEDKGEDIANHIDKFMST